MIQFQEFYIVLTPSCFQYLVCARFVENLLLWKGKMHVGTSGRNNGVVSPFNYYWIGKAAGYLADKVSFWGPTLTFGGAAAGIVNNRTVSDETFADRADITLLIGVVLWASHAPLLSLEKAFEEPRYQQ